MQEKDAQQLLKKYLAGNCTPDEKAILETWYFQQDGKDLAEITDAEADQAMITVWSRMPIHNRNRSRSLWPRIAAAASVVIALGIGTYFLTNHKSTVQQTAQSQPFKNDILPGSNKAILTLANGKRISLTDATNGNIAKQTGVTIRKASNGQLVYDVSNTIHSGLAKIEYNTVEAPVGGQWQVILPDGSHVWLNALSSLTYPTTFTGNERKVTLKGEAYFEISHDRLKPFRVASKDQTVEVLGTHFNVNAYGNEPTTKTTLMEGSVKVTADNQKVIIKPGQQASLAADKINVGEIDTDDVLAWKNGDFMFHDEPIESVMRKLERWYDIDVVYEGPAPQDGFYAAISKYRNISQVLAQLEKTKGAHFKIEGRRVIVSRFTK